MLLTLALLLIFHVFSLNGMGLFEPGFGGYINSIISLVVTGFAFLSAAVIYFFRPSYGRGLFPFGKNIKYFASL